MKHNAIARIIIHSIVALVLTGILVTAIALNELSFDFGNSSGTVVEQSGSVSAADIRKLKIDWAAGAVTIRRGDTDQILFSETAPEDCKYQMAYASDSDTLKLSYGKGTISIGFGNFSIPSKDLTITVPQDWKCETLEIDGASLSIHIHDLKVDTLELDGASCTLGFTGEVRHVDVDGASAELHIECTNRPERIDIDGASCELDLILPKNCGFTVDMDGISYGLNTDLPYTDRNGSKVYGDGQCKINVDGVSCELTISERCGHEWDTGYPAVEPGSGAQVTVYTCLLCGQTKSESIPHTNHIWNEGTPLGENTIVYSCTVCGEIRTLTATPERHGFIWQDWETRKLLEDQIFEPGYYEGAELVFKTEIFTEYTLELYCDGEFICGPTVVGDHWEFYYTMPDHIVYIELRKADA